MTRFDFSAPDVIAEHSAGFAAAARGNLDARVEHCPDWDVAALVEHLTEVHWFWATIVADGLIEEPSAAARPTAAPRDQLVDRFVEGAARLVAVLREADPAAPAWTWAPAQQNAGFVIRHQVQEAVVHHFDAAHAAGMSITADPAAAADSVEEFLTFSVYDGSWPMDPPPPALGGSFGLRCTDIDAAWTVHDGASPSLVAFTRGVADGVPTIAATACDLLLWLYRRVDLDTSALPAGLVDRFYGESFTD